MSALAIKEARKEDAPFIGWAILAATRSHMPRGWFDIALGLDEAGCLAFYTLDTDTLFNEFKQRGASFVKELSFIDDGLWGFEVTDADGYVLAFFQLRNE